MVGSREKTRSGGAGLHRSVSWMRARGGILHRVGGRHGRNAPHPQAVAHNSDDLRFMDMFMGVLGTIFVSI